MPCDKKFNQTSARLDRGVYGESDRQEAEGCSATDGQPGFGQQRALEEGCAVLDKSDDSVYGFGRKLHRWIVTVVERKVIGH